MIAAGVVLALIALGSVGFFCSSLSSQISREEENAQVDAAIAKQKGGDA